MKAKYHGDLSGLTVVTTFNQAMQQAAGSSKSPNDIGLASARRPVCQGSARDVGPAG